jgi:hypothetical protein
MFNSSNSPQTFEGILDSVSLVLIDKINEIMGDIGVKYDLPELLETIVINNSKGNYLEVIKGFSSIELCLRFILDQNQVRIKSVTKVMRILENLQTQILGSSNRAEKLCSDIQIQREKKSDSIIDELRTRIISIRDLMEPRPKNDTFTRLKGKLRLNPESNESGGSRRKLLESHELLNEAIRLYTEFRDDTGYSITNPFEKFGLLVLVDNDLAKVQNRLESGNSLVVDQLRDDIVRLRNNLFGGLDELTKEQMS